LWQDYNAIKYGKEEIQNINVSIPVNTSNATTAIVFIHGFDPRGRMQYWTLIDNYRDKFIVGNMNYRIPDVHKDINMNELLNDLDRAIAAMEKTAKDNNIQIQNLIIIGYSLGGAMTLNYSYRNLQKSHSIPIKFCVSLAGISDFTDPAFISLSSKWGAGLTGLNTKKLLSLFSALSNQSITENDINEFGFNERTANNLRDISPINYINANTLPTLIVHSADDETVPFSNSQNLHNTLEALQIPNVFIETNKLGHSLGTSYLTSKRKMNSSLENAIIEAIDRYIAIYCE
jgi:predicted esterase